MKWTDIEQGTLVVFRPLEWARLYREHIGWEGSRAIACFIAFFASLFASLTMLPALALYGIGRARHMDIVGNMSVPGAIGSIIILFFLGVLWLGIGWACADKIRYLRDGDSFPFPLCRRWPARLLLPGTYHQHSLSVAYGPLIIAGVQLFAVFAICFLLLDLLLTVVVALTRTSHLAVLSGGACAGLAALACPYGGVLPGSVVIAAAFAGGAIAYCWHPIAALLARPTSHDWIPCS